MKNTFFYPENTSAVIKLDRLIKLTDRRYLRERLSSRMVKCASVLEPGEFLGWQMTVPRKGRVGISVFGSPSICKNDLEWIAEKTGCEAAKWEKSTIKATDVISDKLYEIFLPIVETGNTEAMIGFESANAAGSQKDPSVWPSHFSFQFEDLVTVLQNTGAIFRAVVGPASEAEQSLCRKKTLRTYNVSDADANEYIGRPVHMRVLLRLPSAPQARLRAVIEEAVHGARLRFLGNIEDPEATAVWNNPTAQAPVLPDYAARILIMEPEV